MKKIFTKIAQITIAAIVAVVILYPVYQILILALLPHDEIVSYIAQVNDPATGFIPRYFLPRAFSLEQFRLPDERFFRALYVSVVYTGAITVLQFFFAFVIGFVFAKVKFPGREILFFLFLAAMVLPFHVTLVPMHQILHGLELFNTPWAVILPAVFSPLGVFLFRQFISQVPDEVLEAAAIDGAGLFRIMRSIILPMVKNGAAVFFLLTTAMQWSAIEAALSFIRTDNLRPVSLLLREKMSDPATIFAPGVIYMLPMLVVYVLLMNKIGEESYPNTQK